MCVCDSILKNWKLLFLSELFYCATMLARAPATDDTTVRELEKAAGLLNGARVICEPEGVAEGAERDLWERRRDAIYLPAANSAGSSPYAPGLRGEMLRRRVSMPRRLIF